MPRKTRLKGHSASRIGSGGGSVKNSGIPSVSRIAWFDAASINPSTADGAAVTGLVNLSTTQPNAAQPMAAMQPTYGKTAGPDSGASIRFDGTESMYVDYGAGNLSNDNISIAGVWSRDSNAPQPDGGDTLAALSQADAGGSGVGNAGYRHLQVEWREDNNNKSFLWHGDGTNFISSTSTETDTTTDWRCDVVTRSGTSITWLKDGTALTMSTPGANYTVTAQFIWFARTFNSNLDGDIRTLCVWSRVLTVAEQGRIDVRLRGIGGV